MSDGRERPAIGVALGVSVVFYLVYSAVVLWLFLAGRLGFVLDAPTKFLIEQIVTWSVTLTVARRVAGKSWGECYPLRRFDKRLVVPIATGAIGGAVILTQVASFIPVPDSIRYIFEDAMEMQHSIPGFLALTIIAPVAEEHFFRGWMLRGFLQNYSTRTAVIASSALFAVFHLNPWQAVIAFPAGVVFAWFVLQTGSLIPAIIGHAVVNSTGNFVFEPLMSRLGYDTRAIEQMTMFPWAVQLAGILLVIVSGVWLRHVFKKKDVSSSRGVYE